MEGRGGPAPPDMGLDPALAGRILECVRTRTDEWVALVERLTLIESPTKEPSTQRAVQEVIGSELAALGYRVRFHRGRGSGGFLLATVPRRARAPAQLLIGHCDTVWPMGTLAAMPLRREGSRLSGPGVFDMKGGLAHIVLALRVLAELGLEPEVSPMVLVNSDEEIGSPESSRHIRRLAPRVSRTFVLEPALGLEGRLKTRRKGTWRFSIRVSGKSAHAGLDPERGASAIQELALVIQSLHALTDLEAGVMVNVGEVRGGVGPNVVASEATAQVDVRATSTVEGRRIEERILALEARVPGCRLEVRGEMSRPPMEGTPGNRALWAQAKAVGEEMGLDLSEGVAGGGSDGNTTSRFTPTLDGLGAVGDGAHAEHEFVDIDRSVERCALLAALLMAPSSPFPDHSLGSGQLA